MSIFKDSTVGFRRRRNQLQQDQNGLGQASLASRTVRVVDIQEKREQRR